ncbi:hypothetical protein ACS0TY_036673 [Phlomoides rotata]
MEFDTTYFITDVSGKYPRLWALKGAHPVTVNRWYKFGALASIRTIAPKFQEIVELPDWESAKFGTVRKKMKDGPVTKKSHPPHLTHYKLSAIIHDHHTRRVPAVHKDERDRPLAPLYKQLISQKEDHRKIRTSKHIFSFFSTAFGPLFLYSSIREPKEYIRLKVENELRLCWVLLKESMTTVSLAAVE